MVAYDRNSRSFGQAIADVFAGANKRAPSLRMVVQRTGNHARLIGPTGDDIVVDVGAVLLGILEVGRFYRETSSAVWLYEWLEKTTKTDQIDVTLQKRYRNAERFYVKNEMNGRILDVKPSPTLNAVKEYASSVAHDTVGRRNYDLRHLLAAIIRLPQSIAELNSSLGDNLAPLITKLPAFREELFARISASHSSDENVDAWARILEISRETPGSIFGSGQAHISPLKGEGTGSVSPPSRVQEVRVDNAVAGIPENLIAGFSTDQAGTDGPDSLGVDGDVQAFARLICLEQAKPPLSIGLFGGWGAGKSTFMERLEKAIARITDAEKRRREAIKNSAASEMFDTPRFVTCVTHIRFNAWQYSDANLWASLTAEFFDQLRAGGHDRQGAAIHEKLVQRVKEHVSALSGKADATQQALLESERELCEAQKERDKAAANVSKEEDKVLSQTLIDQINAAYEQNKDALAQFGLIIPDVDPAKTIENFTERAKKVRSLPGKLRTIFAAAWHYEWKWPILFVAALLLGLALYVWQTPGALTQIGGAIAAFGSLCTVVWGWLAKPVRIVDKLVNDTAGFGARLEEVKSEALKDVLGKEIILRVKAEEVSARRAAADRASQALARYAGPSGASNSPLLLRFMLDDDPDTKAVEGEIGLISRARRLFQAIDEIARKQRDARDKGEPTENDVPERIVLYIDDLDRCTHDQVYAVLQAVHLLLAFELFVVVVGVDVAWVEDAITRQLNDDQGGGQLAELKRRKRAIAYLEKIFQIPFWLRPLSSDGDGGGSYGRFVGALVGGDETVGDEDEIVVQADDRVERGLGDDEEIGLTPERAASVDGVGPNIPSEDDVAIQEYALDTVRLDKREVDFLAEPVIGAVAAHDPRGVKRMINIYRLVRARMSRSELDKLLDKDDPTYPLLAFFVAIETGQPVEISDALYYGLCCEELPTEDLNLVHIGERVAKKQGDKSENLFARRQDLENALAQVRAHRSIHNLPAEECLAIARSVRRYSFSRVQ